MDTRFWRVTAWALIASIAWLGWNIGGRPDLAPTTPAMAQRVVFTAGDTAVTSNPAGDVLFVWEHVTSEHPRVSVHTVDSASSPYRSGPLQP